MKRRFKKMENKELTEESKMKLAPPWITFANEVIAMFEADEDIKPEYNEDENVLKLFVEGQIKADALSKILPMEKEFGNVKLKIEVIPSDTEESKETLYRNAFANNPNVAFIRKVEQFGFNRTYVVFNKVIAQFYNDDTTDYYGNKSALLQDIARDIFIEDPEVSFCTEAEHKE